MSSSRFIKFENTSLYQNCNECVSWDKEVVDSVDINKYQLNKDFLLNTFNCVGYPSEDQTEVYINDMECINEEDINDFKIYIGIIFEKSFEVHHACKELVNKNIINERKNKNKESKNLLKEEKNCELENIKVQKRLEKDQIKHQKELLREEQLRQRADDREKRRMRKKEDLERYNTETLTCYCGMDYIRNKKVYHMRSTIHEHRMECIKWILNPEILQKYTNNSLEEMDDSTISSLEN